MSLENSLNKCKHFAVILAALLDVGLGDMAQISYHHIFDGIVTTLGLKARKSTLLHELLEHSR